VLALDEAVGKLIQGLKDSGQYDNTLIVFTSDQGFARGQHGFRSKLAPYDATIRSPWIFSMPAKLPSGEVCGRPVSGPDLIPTFFKVAGIDLPWKMHGRDLTPLLEKPDRTWSFPALMAHTGRSYGSATDVVPTDRATLSPSGVPWWVSLRLGRYKYIRNLVEGEIEELYDLESDPEELDNLALVSKHDRTLQALREATVAELRRTDAGFADRLPKVGTAAARTR
jgi:arylsulfatase A-like enzyme